MKNKKILLLLVFTMFLTACNHKIELSQTTTEASTNYENDKINIKIANDMDEKEEIYENILEDLQKIDNFSPIKNIWIVEGLYEKTFEPHRELVDFVNVVRLYGLT